MIVRVQKWGNSLAVRLPMHVAKEAKLEEGSELDLSEEAGYISLKPVEHEHSLHEMVLAITPENMHSEVNFGGARGSEIW